MYRIVLVFLFLVSSCKTIEKEKQWVNPEQNKEPIDVIYGWEQLEDKLHLTATNKRLLPLEFQFTEKESGDLVKNTLIQPEATETIHVFSVLDKAKAVQILRSEFKYGYVFGDKNSIKPDLNYLYRLPFADGKSYKVVQSFGGKSSHSSESSFHAIDFDMKQGEPIHAARAGLVIVAIDWFNEGGKRKELTKKANKVVILHDDGSIGSYAHVDYKKVFVKDGDRVEEGQLLAESGNTGFSGGAHLHFVVRGALGKSIPVYFKGYAGQVLKRGTLYQLK